MTIAGIVPETVQVIYRVPVVVEVNVEDGTVERVVMCDEEITLDSTEPTDDEATKIAESADWPAWDFGF